MQIGVSVVNRGALAQPEFMVRFVRRAEELGVHSATVTDHIVIPKAVPSNYPYHPKGEFHWEEAREYYEPLSLLTFLAGSTEKIRLGVSVLIISYRNPVIVAKMLATIDALSGGRVFLGVGTGWWEDEYKALGIPGHFRERGKRTDEYIRIYRELWSNEEPAFDGEFYQFDNIEVSPKPAQKGGIPIWIGGHTNRALRRAAELGDAWHPIGLRPPAALDPQDLAAKRDQLAELAQAAGRDPKSIPICFRAPIVFSDSGRAPLMGNNGQIVEDIKAYEAVGVSHITLDVVGGSADEVFGNMERMGQEILPHVS